MKKPPSELKLALDDLRPYFVRAGWFSLFSSLLILIPSWYMLEVYDRVVNSQSCPMRCEPGAWAVIPAYSADRDR